LRDKRDKLIDEKAIVRGQITESMIRIEKEGKELRNPRYRDAKKNFLEGCIKEKVLTAMIGHLHKYRAALERALLKFHADKMVQINQSIRGYWNTIYKGNDIVYIKTYEEEKKATSNKKRSYSYRVVQCKNGGSEIDMRGRCSAGQKVLASLIIRMALADTFAAHCGILALDEPTTNLDQKNIQALCKALNDIIKEREAVGNFMLLVITHDEEFVRVLQNVEEFFKLSRDPNGRSRIEKNR
jgi:DNA repair protein RAD50